MTTYLAIPLPIGNMLISLIFRKIFVNVYKNIYRLRFSKILKCLYLINTVNKKIWCLRNKTIMNFKNK